ncbi:hypothetical protein B0T26DRAFT_640527 [Lasiosphaeria miniovina]|uniref:SET domain-containing protein n=1 Tax=Lasiosphaeria miniovina TaxID=1954250 RepID=A0AA40AVY8_9PEZI|nr:uncharacterized protein B0T26DRAFT_640527 [Lasiosphaeria miniovina]KAK0722948.1 hypothetical protein B0T26DRAFT_640527 [Lasiosphaeria miniovina]
MCLASSDYLVTTPQYDDLGRQLVDGGRACGNGTGCGHVPDHTWTHSTPCFKGTISDIEICTFTDANFAQGRGASFVMTAKRASYLATHSGFVNPEIIKGVNEDLEPASPAKYEMREFPGKGMGLVATDHIRRGDLIMGNTVSLMIDYKVFNELPKEQYIQLEAAAFDHLPGPHRSALLKLSTHEETDLPYAARVDKITATNAFDINPDHNDEDQDYAFFVVFPGIARMNHDCRANADYYYDHDTMTQYIHAMRPISPGEEITISYINPKMRRADRMERLKRLWGFDCACHLCAQGRAQAEASDERIDQIKELYPDLRSFQSSSRASPQMAELLISLAEQETLGGTMYEAYTFAALEYNGIGDAWTATKYARLAIEWGLTTVGEKDGDVNDMKELVVDPWKHWSWMLRTRKKNGWGKEPADDE